MKELLSHQDYLDNEVECICNFIHPNEWFSDCPDREASIIRTNGIITFDDDPDMEELTFPSRFELGQIVITQNAWDVLSDQVSDEAECMRYMAKALTKHRLGDWGGVDKDDAFQNERAVKFGQRILSSYLIKDVKVWIITEADRSVTTLLLPEDY